MRYGDSFPKGFEIFNHNKTKGYRLLRDVFEGQATHQDDIEPIGSAPPMVNGSIVPGWVKYQLMIVDY